MWHKARRAFDLHVCRDVRLVGRVERTEVLMACDA